MLVAIFPVLAIILGILLWALASNGIVKDVGRIIFAAGVLVTLLVVAHYTIRIG